MTEPPPGVMTAIGVAAGVPGEPETPEESLGVTFGKGE
jgi:hypothetical protein